MDCVEWNNIVKKYIVKIKWEVGSCMSVTYHNDASSNGKNVIRIGF